MKHTSGHSLTRSRAGGSVVLASADPFDPPIIDPNFLNTTFDIYTLRTAVRAAARLMSAPTWDGISTGQAGPFADVDLSSDDAVDAWVRAQASTIWHPVGTARMGACEDEASVVDPDMRVKGAYGVRVVDASVFVSAFDDRNAMAADCGAIADYTSSTSSSTGVCLCRASSRPHQERIACMLERYTPGVS